MVKLLFDHLWTALAMKVVCAWCGAHLEGDPSDSEVSHGICGDCEKKHFG